MGFLDGLRSLFTGLSSGDMYAMYIYVRCQRCGEKVRLRMDRRFDLEQEFGENLVTGYVANKDILGRNCPNLIRVHIEYDQNFRPRTQEVHGGQLITRQEYEAQ
ncbi:MAG: hypothetical protein M1370_03270 [Bacteroidetes bacterium]|nr:hypothetical protein [Bacteroidota bacterium]MCL5025541.1 hypothetical protein [Chloroflexota bacterium]